MVQNMMANLANSTAHRITKSKKGIPSSNLAHTPDRLHKNAQAPPCSIEVLICQNIFSSGHKIKQPNIKKYLHFQTSNTTQLALIPLNWSQFIVLHQILGSNTCILFCYSIISK